MDHRIRSNARRLRSAVQRVEQTPYDMEPGRRQPRLGGAAAPLYCVLGSSLAAATGSWPSITPGKVTGQQVYTPTYDGTNYSAAALPSSNSTILNYTATAFVTGKTAEVRPSGFADAYCVVVQDC